jgi:uncharacterized protein (TIRG00374 family)
MTNRDLAVAGDLSKQKYFEKLARYSWLLPKLRWIILALVLYLIFQQIDFATFKLSIARTNPWLVALGLTLIPLVILIGALRWRLLLAQYHGRWVQVSFAVKHYWIGRTLGFFMPGSLAGYRVVVSGRRFGHYTLNTAIVIVEKLMALVACTSIVVVLYPFVSVALPPKVEKVFNWSYIFFFVCIFLFAGISLGLRNRGFSILLEQLELRFSGVLRKIGGKLGLRAKSEGTALPLRAMLKPLTIPKQVMGVLVLSLGIQLVVAARSQIFFRALDYDLPFTVNLFVVTFAFFVRLLPLSLAGLGIGKGVSILLYGLFGVPAELALLVSFLDLFGLLLSNAIGGGMMLFFNVKGESQQETIFQTQGENLTENYGDG